MPDGGQARKAELLAAGTRIGRYHLLQRLAVGGMAELYLACAEGLAGFQKVVVLKHVLPHLATDPDFVELFLNEARIAATLAHPNIVHVTDIGEASGDYFYAMEYVHGRNARELLRAGSSSGGIPLDVALTIAIAAASAIEHTHAARDVNGERLGLIHRDVSPANILVSYEGTAKLTDFGIAKASEKSTETIGGAVKGKIGYMPPEQCRGEKIDQRSDIFALGVVLFELTTCQRLFYGDNDFAILTKVLKGRVDRPSERVPDYPPELESIVIRALAPEPAQRYQTAAELRRDLESFAHDARLRCTPATVATWMESQFGAPEPPRVEVLRAPGSPKDAPQPTLVVTAHTEDRDSQELVAVPFHEAQTVPNVSEPVVRPKRRLLVVGMSAFTVAGGLLAWLAFAAPANEAAPARAAEPPKPTVAQPEAPQPDAPILVGPDDPEPAAEPDPDVAPSVPDVPPEAEQPKRTEQTNTRRKKSKRRRKKRDRPPPPKEKKIDMNAAFPAPL